MRDAPRGELPQSVVKRDGRLVPFEADKISQSLYAATEALGQPSAFMARELTDGVLHFLAAELDEAPPTTGQIAETVAKVVRELGHPALSQAIVDRARRKQQQPSAAVTREKIAREEVAFRFSTKDAPDAVTRKCLRAYSLHAVFARDLAAAHEEGLLTLAGLEHPDELASQVIFPDTESANGLVTIEAPARTILVDSPEWALTEGTAGPWLRRLAAFCECTGRQAIVNLHVATPAAWAVPPATGPLFTAPSARPDFEHRRGLAELLVEENNGLDTSPVHIEWHLTDADFDRLHAGALAVAARQALARKRVSFVMDRARQPIALGRGVDREGSAVLIEVVLELPRLLAMPGVDHDGGRFLEKLPSLARMALRAGIQKRGYLRTRAGKHPSLARGFLVDRARLVVIPGGLEEVVQSLLGRPLSASEISLDFGRQVVEVLHAVLRREGAAGNLDAALNVDVCAEVETSLSQVHAAGVLHAISGFGTLVSASGTVEQLVSTLTHAWKKTALARMA